MKNSPLAVTLRGYAQTAPDLWRPHLAAAADAVEECARLRAERDELVEHRHMWIKEVAALRSDTERMALELSAAEMVCLDKDADWAAENARAKHAERETEALRAERDRISELHAESQAEIDRLRAELDAARADVVAAAGTLMIDVPAPGTDMARVMHANAMLRAERDAMQRRLDSALGSECEGTIAKGEGYVPACRTLRAERDEARADARMWMGRYSSLFIRVSCGVAPDTTERGIYLAWQREVDEAYATAAAKGSL